MPCHYPTNLNEYTSIWCDIVDTCDNCHVHNVIIGGDLNTGIERHNSQFTQYLLQMLHNEQLHIYVT